MPVALEQFVSQVATSGVISAEKLRDVLDGLPAGKQPTDAQQLARLLVKQKN